MSLVIATRKGPTATPAVLDQEDNCENYGVRTGNSDGDGSNNNASTPSPLGASKMNTMLDCFETWSLGRVNDSFTLR